MLKFVIGVITLLFALAHAQIGIDLGGTLDGVVNIGGILYGSTCSLISSGLWSSSTCWTGGILPNLEGTASVTIDASVALTVDTDASVDYLNYGQCATTVADNHKFSVNRCDWHSGGFQVGSGSEFQIHESTTVYPASSNACYFRSNGNGKVRVDSAAKVNVASNANLFASGVALHGGQYQVADYATLNAESCSVTAPTYVRGSTYSKAKVSGNTNVDSNLYLHSHTDNAASSSVNLRGYGAVEVANNANWNLYGCTVSQAGTGNIVTVGSDFASTGKIIVQQHATPCQFKGGYYDVKAQGQVHVEENAVALVSADTETGGAGTHHYKGKCESNSAYKIGNKHIVYSTGEIHVKDAGYVHIGHAGNGGELEVNSGKCRTTSAGTQSHYVVGAASGAAAYLRFRGSEAAPCEVHGGNYETKPTGQINVEQYGKTVIKAATKFRGSNKVNVIGHLAAESPLTCEAPVHVHETGKLNFNSAYDHSLKSLTYASDNCETVIRASSTGFKPIKVTESAAYKGKLTVDAGSYVPTKRVTLVDCANSGGSKYSSVSVVGAAASKGKVVYDGSKVCYDPL